MIVAMGRKCYIKMQGKRHRVQAKMNPRLFSDLCNPLSLNGFSLVELLIVVAIIGALSAIGIPNYLKYRENAMIVSAIAELRIIDRVITAYETDTGNLPASLDELKVEIIDPWGNPYQYLNIRDAKKKAMGRAIAKVAEPQIKER